MLVGINIFFYCDTQKYSNIYYLRFFELNNFNINDNKIFEGCSDIPEQYTSILSFNLEIHMFVDYILMSVEPV